MAAVLFGLRGDRRHRCHVFSVVPSSAGQEHTLFFPFVRKQFHPKKGITASAWSVICRDADMVGATQIIHWHPSGFPDCPNQAEIPMIAIPERDLPKPIAPAEWLGTFNEPDECGPYMSCLTPYEATVIFHDHIEGLPYKIVAPGVTGFHPEWLIDWWNTYKSLYGHPPDIHAVSFHCYDSYLGCKARGEYYLGLAAGFAQELGHPVETWMTEFEVRSCHYEDWKEQLRNLVLWANVHLDFYAYFPQTRHPSWPPSLPGCEDPLVDYETGTLTEAGEVYWAYP